MEKVGSAFGSSCALQGQNPTLADQSMHASWKPTSLRESVWKELCQNIMKIALQRRDSIHQVIAILCTSLSQSNDKTGCHDESTVRRLEQEVEELQSMIKKVGLDQDARYEELRSSADGLIQTERAETDPATRETSQLTVKPRLSAL